MIAWAGWYRFWCQPFEAIYTKLFGMMLLVGCSSAFLSLVFGSTDVSGKTFDAGGSLGGWLGAWFAEYLNRTGSIIVIMTLMVLSVILSTQFSFGRMFANASQGSRDLSARSVGFLRAWLDDRRKQKQRREVIAQAHQEGCGRGGDRQGHGDDQGERGRIVRATGRGEEARHHDGSSSAAPRARTIKGAAPPGRVYAAAAVAARPAKPEQKIDERELMDSARQLEEKCREFAVEGQVAQIHPGPVVTTFEFKPDAGVKCTARSRAWPTTCASRCRPSRC